MKVLMTACLVVTTSQAKVYETQSPNGKLCLSVDDSNGKLQVSLRHGDEVLLKPSTIALELSDGKVWGTQRPTTASATQKSARNGGGTLLWKRKSRE